MFQCLIAALLLMVIHLKGSDKCFDRFDFPNYHHLLSEIQEPKRFVTVHTFTVCKLKMKRIWRTREMSIVAPGGRR